MTIAPWPCEWCMHDPCYCDEIVAWTAEYTTVQLYHPPPSTVVVVIDAQEEEELEEPEVRCAGCRSIPCRCEENDALCQLGCYVPCCCAEQDAWNREHMWFGLDLQQ